MSESLSLADKHDLKKLEERIGNAKDFFYKEAGESLIEIRERRLWRGQYDSFDDYCLKRWEWNRKRADHLIKAVETVRSLPTPTGRLITNERQARELARVDPQDRVTVVEEAAKDGNLTAASISKAAARVSEPEKVLDPTGREVHATLMELWNRRDELNPLATQVSKLKCFLEKKMEEGDPLFSQLHTDAIIKLKTLHYYITSAKFEYVCGFCQGKCKILEQECPNCASTGLMTRWQWERQVPESLKRGLKK